MVAQAAVDQALLRPFRCWSVSLIAAASLSLQAVTQPSTTVVLPSRRQAGRQARGSRSVRTVL